MAKKEKPKKEKAAPFTNQYLCDIDAECDTTAIPEGKYEGKRTGHNVVIEVDGKPVILESVGRVEGIDNKCIIRISKKSKPRAQVFSFFP